MTNRLRSRALLLGCGILLASGVLAGKEKITFIASGTAKHQAKPATCEIEVFLETKPERVYVIVGVVNYHDERHRLGDGSLTLESALPKMKERACKAGGEAMVDVRVTEVRRLEFAMFNVRATVVRFEPR